MGLSMKEKKAVAYFLGESMITGLTRRSIPG